MENNNVILFLGPNNSPLLFWLRNQGENVIQTSEKITPSIIDENNVVFLISYGYRYILKNDIIGKLINKAINLHISYLPYNRGADPNFWSFIEDTPKGVIIHYLDEGVDTGDIIIQKEVKFSSDNNETLATTYEKLQIEIQQLFIQHWVDIKNGNISRKKQIGKGSFHKAKDKETLSQLLSDGWNTSVSVLEEYAAETQMSMQFREKYDEEIAEIRKKGNA